MQQKVAGAISDTADNRTTREERLFIECEETCESMDSREASSTFECVLEHAHTHTHTQGGVGRRQRETLKAEQRPRDESHICP